MTPLLAALALSASLPASALHYPPTPTTDTVDVYHGTAVADPYRWLEDLDAPRTQGWIDEQNALTLPLLAALPQRGGFARRLAQLWDVTQTGVPVAAGGRYFYTRRAAGQNQPVLMVADGVDAEPRVLLDPNTLSANGTVAMAGFKPSPDGRWLLWASAEAGSDWNRYRIREVTSGADLADVLERIKFSEVSWTADSSGFIYSRYPDPPVASAGLNQTVFDDLANQKVYLHRLRSAQSEDRLLFERPEHPRWFVRGDSSDDGRYALYSAFEGSADENRLFVAALGDASAPDFGAAPRTVVDNFDASYEPVGSSGDRLFLLTNLDAPRRRIIALDLRQPELSRATSVVPESADTLQAARLVGGQLVVLRLHDATSRIERYALDGTPLGAVPLPELGAVADLEGKADAPELFFAFEAYNRPSTVYRVDLSAAEPRPVAFAAPQLAFDPADFVTEQRFFSSRDGTRVPMFVSHRRGLKPDGQRPVFLHGYGGFDIAKLPDFDPSALAWMEQGGVYAVANLRGGGEYGREWHLAGTRERKQNVFDDFYAAARDLVASGWTQPRHIAIWGRSNGGLLVGASLNQHPAYWGAAVATVGVMDMLRFHTFTVGYAWTGDFGSSETPDGFAVLKAYSPLHTVKPGTHYPPTLITTGDHDDRVHPSHSYKYAATLQKAQAGAAPVLIRIDRDAGHGAGKPTAKLIDEEADKLAFMWYHVSD